MPFTGSEVTQARGDVEKEFGVTLSDDLAYSLACKVEDKKNGMPFNEALRFALNELNIRNKKGEEKKKGTRSAYAKVIGKLFGSHGGRKAALNRQLKTPKQSQKPSVIGKTFEDDDRQYAFKI